LSYILEKIYNNSYAAILNFKILKPLGLNDTYFGSKIKSQKSECYSYHFKNGWVKSTETDLSIPMGAGAIVSTPTDLTAFTERLFSGKIISKQSLALMKTMNDFHGIGIGMGLLACTNFGKKSYGHNGAIDGFASLLSYSPDEKLTVALTSNGSIYPVDSVLSCALSCYFNRPFAMPNFTYVAVEPKVLKQYLGHYTSQQLPLKIEITTIENKLFGQVKGQPVFPLEATAANIFRFEQAGLFLEFDANKKQMILKQGGQEFLFTKE
jgi:CubicO group peptidase (beta-lactamase class C family)